MQDYKPCAWIKFFKENGRIVADGLEVTIKGQDEWVVISFASNVQLEAACACILQNPPSDCLLLAADD